MPNDLLQTPVADSTRMTRDQTRAAMPLCTAFIDDMREHFGPPVAIRASENGHDIFWRRDAATSKGD